MSLTSTSDKVTQAAKRAGFYYGEDSNKMFLSAVSHCYANIDTEAKFLDLSEDRQEKITVEVKTRHLAKC